MPAAGSTTAIAEGIAPTTSLLVLVGVTYTETVTLPPSTVWLSLTTSTTSTKTASLAAPNFTHVFGPKAGCVDIAVATGYQLDSSITDVNNATQECQGLCAQNWLCEHVYVQRLFTNYGTARPYFECNFNQQHLNVIRDLQCGSRVGTWGVANGYDAYGRGQ